MLSKDLEFTLNNAFKEARARRFELMTVEHLLLAMTDNPTAAQVLRACGSDLDDLRAELDSFIEENTPLLDENDTRETQPTLGFQRVLQRAVFHAQSSGEKEVTGANVLIALFGEQDSQAVYLLNKQNITRLDVTSCVGFDISKPLPEEPPTTTDEDAGQKSVADENEEGAGDSKSLLSKELEFTLNNAFKEARARRFEFMTVEHLLLAMIDNPTAAQVLHACGGNLDDLRDELDSFIEENTPLLEENDTRETQPTLGFQRVLQRAVFYVQSSGKKEVTGANVLVACFGEQDSQAVYLLNKQDITRLDVVNYISHGLSKPLPEKSPATTDSVAVAVAVAVADENEDEEGAGDSKALLSKELEFTLNNAFKEARARRFEFMTVEHLLLAMIDNPTAAEVLRACGGDLDILRDELDRFIEMNTPLLEENDTREPQPTLDFQRVLQRAVFHMQSSGEKEVTGANVLVACFGESDSQAAYLLDKQNITRLDVTNHIFHQQSEHHSEAVLDNTHAQSEAADSVEIETQALLVPFDGSEGDNALRAQNASVDDRRTEIHPLQDGFATCWASSWGEDEHGAFCCFSIAQVTQCMRWVPSGSFSPTARETGADGTLASDHQGARVLFPHGFWIADTACTQALWNVVEGNTPSTLAGDDRPIEQVSWLDVQTFIRRLNTRVPGLFARLPTELEWEYAVLAGAEEPYWFGARPTLEQVNIRATSATADSEHGTLPGKNVSVKELGRNPFGLYRVNSNVWEWCQDRYETLPSKELARSDADERRVLRGGSWTDQDFKQRATYRNFLEPSASSSDIGFRLAAG